MSCLPSISLCFLWIRHSLCCMPRLVPSSTWLLLCSYCFVCYVAVMCEPLEMWFKHLFILCALVSVNSRGFKYHLLCLVVQECWYGAGFHWTASWTSATATARTRARASRCPSTTAPGDLTLSRSHLRSPHRCRKVTANIQPKILSWYTN